MSREVYTYSNLAYLKDSSIFNKIKYYPIITVSSDLKKALKGNMTYDQVEGLFSTDSKVIVTEFHNVAVSVDSYFNSDQAKFNRLIILSEYIRHQIEKANNIEDKNWLTGCIRNINSLLSSITLLEQANVKPADIDIDGERNIQLLVDSWNYLLERDSSIEKYQETVNGLKRKSNFNNVLNKAFNTSISFDKFEKIVLMGFYFMTPFQERIIKCLEDAGYDLIFFIQYDERYPFVHEIWDKTYSTANGYPDKTKWNMEKCREANPYADIFNGADCVELPNHIEIREYASVIEFVNDVKKEKNNGYFTYSAGFKNANEILKDYYPEEYGERKILSYPVGQFINTLNKMWDEDKKTIVLDEDGLIDCFSSGWLSLNGVSGKQYLQDLLYLLPFFKGCRYIKEWEIRLNKLNEIYEKVNGNFEFELDPEESVARWQQTVGNPLNSFSMFALEKGKADIILGLIKQLFKMANELFTNNNNISVSQHIYKLDNILRKYEISDEIYTEERKIVGDIFDKLGDANDFKIDCTPSDIARALNLYMSGKYDDGEIQTNKMGMIYPLFFIDAACVKNNSKVHICLCDVNTLPGGKKDYVWPLTGKLIKKCREKTNNYLLSNVITIMETDALCNRFFTYCAIKNNDVILSWINNINEKILAPSPYIKLISRATNIDIKAPKRNEITFDNVYKSAYGAGKITKYDNDKSPRGMVKEAKMAYALCPMKYVLGYVTEKYPSFQSDFQQNYAMNALISSIYGLLRDKGVTINEVYDNVIELFPQLRKTERRQIRDFIRYDQNDDDLNYENRTQCGDYFFTDERIRIQYPNRKVRQLAVKRFTELFTPDGRKGMNLYEVMEATDREKVFGKKDDAKTACQYCPHIAYCRNAIYAGDQEDYYD